jgi:ubiquinone/menaquinone biosynthesis C-methylase UbiE
MNDLMSLGIHRLWKRRLAKRCDDMAGVVVISPAAPATSRAGSCAPTGAYQYLVESIWRFPDQREFAKQLTVAGFRDVHWENLSFGFACLHFGTQAA